VPKFKSGDCLQKERKIYLLQSTGSVRKGTYRLLRIIPSKEEIPRALSISSVENGSFEKVSCPAQAHKSVPSFSLCKIEKSCEELRALEFKCSRNKLEVDCRNFTNAFKELSKVKNCKREFDYSPVPSIWICDLFPQEQRHPRLTQRSAETLSKLSFSFAKSFYNSDQFQLILDGELALDHKKE